MTQLKKLKDTAIDYAIKYGGTDGHDHKAWVIDQMVRALTNCPIIKNTEKTADGKEYQYETQGESQQYIKLIEVTEEK